MRVQSSFLVHSRDRVYEYRLISNCLWGQDVRIRLSFLVHVEMYYLLERGKRGETTENLLRYNR
jgi:hypothetical protein